MNGHFRLMGVSEQVGAVTAINYSVLANMLGWMTGAALYAMLCTMALRYPRHRPTRATGMTLAAASLGLVWNLGSFVSATMRELLRAEPVPVLDALAFVALGFLPAVVVQAVVWSERARVRRATWAAYGLSVAAAFMHFRAALFDDAAPSALALRLLTWGYLLIIVTLLWSTRRHRSWRRVLWASALAFFTVSATHLSHHRTGSPEHWIVELVGHHASLPLALAALYQDYRFAFADLFLKRALTLLALIATATSGYALLIVPLLQRTGERIDPMAAVALVGLCVLTATLQPIIKRWVDRFVDGVILGRVDYEEFRARFGKALNACERAEEVLALACDMLAPVLSARSVRWTTTDASEVAGNPEVRDAVAPELARGEPDGVGDEPMVIPLERTPAASALVFIPTVEPPFHVLVIGELTDGRRLLSDDVEMLETMAVAIARRVDALRVTHERCEQSLREQQISKLAAEAQLRALRAQINPHFLFNALTTIGYLIKTAPDRAFETLMKLTELLRRVLQTTGEFVTLGEELKLVMSYLDIERERFEERLRVRVEVPPELYAARVPSLVLQPVVENAIKHGLTRSRFGGEVSIVAQSVVDGGEAYVHLIVRDTGLGASTSEMARGRARGVGLRNIEERLRCYYGERAWLKLESIIERGTTVEIRLPLTSESNVTDFIAKERKVG